MNEDKMDRALAKLISLIPERAPRAPSGTIFLHDASASAHGERFAHLARLLTWLTPLAPLTQDDRRLLGLLSPGGRADQGMPGEEEDEPDVAFEN